jgi:hypothetical protein
MHGRRGMMRGMRGRHMRRGRGLRGHGNGPRKRMARLVRHKNVEDGTRMPTGTAFSKTWIVRNDSDQPWPTKAHLVHIGGDELTNESTRAQVVPPLEPGKECEVTLDPMQAPSLPGLYKGVYRFEGESGQRFGQRLWCSILAE